MVEESELAAASEIIGKIDHGPKSRFGSTLAATYGPLALLLVVTIAFPPAWIAFWLLATIISLPRVCARIRFSDTNRHGEMTRCLDCGATLSETETTCPKCGWSYEAANSPEPR